MSGNRKQLHNPGFNPVDFDGIRMQAGLNSFALTPKQRKERTGAIGIIFKAGRYGGTFAHQDIAIRQMQTLAANAERLLEGGREG